MSTQIETEMTEHTACKFWGGNGRGVCVQISKNDDSAAYLALTMAEASALVNTLMPFIKEEAQRRQGLLREFLADLKSVERRVFHEIGELSPEFFETVKTSVELVDKFCPKVR
jgi:ABC-type transporter Mla subunit MlaD